eukprot:32185_1
MKANNTLKYDEDKGYFVIVQTKKKAINKKKKRTQNNNKITPPVRKYKCAYSRTQRCEEYVISPNHIKGGLKVMKKHIDAAERVQNPYVGWTTVDIHYMQYIQTSEPVHVGRSKSYIFKGGRIFASRRVLVLRT